MSFEKLFVIVEKSSFYGGLRRLLSYLPNSFLNGVLSKERLEVKG